MSVSYFIILLTAFIVNIPCGFLREHCPKFSKGWFFWIHASIPVLIYLRVTTHVSPLIIPFSIFFAVIGQIIGSRHCRKIMTQQQKDSINQIPELCPLEPEIINDHDVLVALLNMGGPKKRKDIKAFQKNLFEDPLLIRFPMHQIFQKLFATILIKFRLNNVIATYEEMGLGGGSPIYNSTIKQAQALRQELKNRGREIDVTFSFNYSPPFPKDTINKCLRNNKSILLPLSLYPHYSKATTGSNLYYLRKEQGSRYPDLKIAQTVPYYLHDGYIQAFVERIQEQINPEESLDDFYLVFSAHGLPLYFLMEGDPYPFQIAQTVGCITSKLKRNDRWIISYQSSVGPFQWLKPSTDKIIPALAQKGIQKILMVPVSFVGDHIETICEIDQEYRELAEKNGIKDYRMSKAIEAHPGFIQALADSIESAFPKSTKNSSLNTFNLNTVAQTALNK